MLILNPTNRIKVMDILNHDYFKTGVPMISQREFPNLGSDSHEYIIRKNRKLGILPQGMPNHLTKIIKGDTVYVSSRNYNNPSANMNPKVINLNNNTISNGNVYTKINNNNTSNTQLPNIKYIQDSNNSNINKNNTNSKGKITTNTNTTSIVINNSKEKDNDIKENETSNKDVKENIKLDTKAEETVKKVISEDKTIPTKHIKNRYDRYLIPPTQKRYFNNEENSLNLKEDSISKTFPPNLLRSDQLLVENNSLKYNASEVNSNVITEICNPSNNENGVQNQKSIVSNLNDGTEIAKNANNCSTEVFLRRKRNVEK